MSLKRHFRAVVYLGKIASLVSLATYDVFSLPWCPLNPPRARSVKSGILSTSSLPVRQGRADLIEKIEPPKRANASTALTDPQYVRY